MAISSGQCSPYLSVSLFAAVGAAPVASAILARIKTLAKETADQKELERPRFTTVEDPDIEVAGTAISWAHYSVKRPPSWFSGDELQDIAHHLIVVAKRANIIAISFSDTGLRNTIVRKIVSATDGPFASISRLTSIQINRAFVESEVRTLWLSGIHTRTAIKPDSKILSGQELESSLDPLGDQSYYFSSVRSTMSLSDVATSKIVGASPTSGRIWLGPSQSWEEFTTNLNLILARAAKFIEDEGRPDRPLPILASTIDTLEGIEQPYGMALIVPEQVRDGAAGEANDDARLIAQFGDVAKFELTAIEGSPSFETAVFWGENQIGKLAYDFEVASNSKIRLKARKLEGFDQDAIEAEVLKVLQNTENLTIYFDTGHTYSRGHFYETRFRDARFENWDWVRMDLDDTAFDKEKPLDGKRFAVEQTGSQDDRSLFGLVAKHWPNLADRGAPTGWLVCDDGSMESADFIHLDDQTDPPRLTLIHVKGSGSDNTNRELSVPDYEVVTGQAVKNLRHIDRGLLKEKLTANANGVLKDAVWHDGVRQQNRDEFFRTLDGLGSKFAKTVVVFQPRVRKSVYETTRERMDLGDKTSKDVRQLQQLDALLLGARADCYSLGAEFKVISDGDDL
ncbi:MULTISPECIES: hypothetical protein [Stappiaceae]|jgi:hypothetical protein|uniref:hypothetical protein n=1 Tax=Stappiaceae TaxID=2821832 RepID=UPI001ADD6142|nr:MULTISPECIES: hypothetical protein [Stappiaceae]MBO9463161.1 hypothetical protein [Labrenzia sp. R5_0]